MINLASSSDPIGASQRPIGAADYARIARELKAAPPRENLRALRLGVLSSCTLQFAEPSLIVESARRGLQLGTYFGPFGQFEQQISDPASALHAFQPQALLLFMRPEDLNPDAVYRYHSAAQGEHALHAIIDRLISCVEAFRQHSTAPILVANFAVPHRLPLGPFDANANDSLTYAIAAANHALQMRLAQVPDAIVWDYAGLVRESGSAGWSDRRLWALARIPVAADRQPVLSRHLARSLAGVAFTPAKCLVLDLDNTLWGGVLGDDGIEGIQLGDDYPGSAFKAFQRAVLGLADRGVLLAVVSKNYPEIVDQALREHPEMLIRPEHLSAMRVNWEPKSGNLRAIAAELNLGIDALVHFDDNPKERAEIAANAPEVRLVEVPADPLGFEQALYDCGYFDAKVLYQEDRQRVEMYRSERARETVRASTHNVEDFLTGLEMVAEAGKVDEANLGRVAQLVGKTNQFNLTTRRHSQADLSRMSSDPDHDVFYLRLRDRFGDLGLIATGVLSYQGAEAVIDTFVMSCRAMGRLAENALIWELAQAAHSRGCKSLIGDYLPTARNGIVADLYSTLGFSRASLLDGGGERFCLDLTDSKLEWPSVIRRTVPLPEGRS